MKALLSFIFVFGALFATENNLDSFTGRVNSNKVRLRTEPNVDSSIVGEAKLGQHFLVVGQVNDFYVVRPSSDTKFYVYRIYVIDGMIEGNNVNVRLQPDIESPIVMQVQSGTNVYGDISKTHSKWLEIQPPEGTYFYIAQEFVERIGDSEYIFKAESREKEVAELLQQMQKNVTEEMKKPFHAMDMEEAEHISMKFITYYNDFKEEMQQVTQLLHQLKEDYLTKKAHNLNIANEEKEVAPIEVQKAALEEESEMTNMQQKWHQVEYNLYLNWMQANPENSFDDFKKISMEKAVRMEGKIEKFESDLPTKPGEFLLIQDGLPVAYLYSLDVNLDECVGKEISFSAVQRPNNHFAFPSYCILQTE